MRDQILKAASQMVIMDAIEKGHTDKDKLIEFMNTDYYLNAVSLYAKMLKKEL